MVDAVESARQGMKEKSADELDGFERQEQASEQSRKHAHRQEEAGMIGCRASRMDKEAFWESQESKT
jgi:hypothetical protein